MPATVLPAASHDFYGGGGADEVAAEVAESVWTRGEGLVHDPLEVGEAVLRGGVSRGFVVVKMFERRYIGVCGRGWDGQVGD